MELHSYAKRRAASKKWTVEQKRKLVDARIANDGIFLKKPSNCLTTWKKITTLAKLDDFSVNFVRKQWSNMVAKYKQFKQSRLDNMSTNAIDDEMLRKVTQEWEFFYPIHRFMSRKITNLHSYALTQGKRKQKVSNSNITQQAKKEQNENNSCLASQMETMLAASADSTLTAETPTHDSIVPSPEIKAGQNDATFSSDTNDDYAATQTISNEVRNNDSQETHCTSATTCRTEAQTLTQVLEDDIHSNTSATAMKIQNTDHDFYSKKSPIQRKWANRDDEVTKSIECEIKTEISDDNNTQTDKETNLNQINSTNIIEQRKCELDQESIATTLNNTETLQNNTLNRVNFNATCSSNPKPTIMVMIPKEEPKENDAKQHQERCKRNERDNYYKHKRRFNRRLERRFDAILNVFGQIVKAEYPSIDVSPLFGATVTTNGPQQAASQNGFFGGATFSSDEFSDAEMSTSNDEITESQEETTME